MDPLFLPFVAFTILCLLLGFAIILLKKQNVKLASQLQQTRQTLQETRQHLDATSRQLEELSSFQQSMVEAQLTTRLQTARGSVKGLGQCTTPEKYQYIYTLTEKGMNADEIASVLSISRHEATQLVSLARIAHKNRP